MQTRVVIVPTAVVLRAVMAAIVGTLLLSSSSTLASPPETSWVEDIHLHPSGPAELSFLYEYQAAEDDAVSEDIDLLTVRATAGFDRVPLELAPTFGLRQVEGTAAQLDHVGMRTRYRLAGTPGVGTAALWLGYRVLLGSGQAHLLEQGAAGRWHSGSLSVTGELSIREVLGDDTGTDVELRVGAAASYGFVLNLIRLGVEAFALVSLAGDRISDPSLSADTGDVSLYVGPSLRMDFEGSVWFTVSAVTGELLDAGSPLMMRAVFGTQF